MVYYMELSQGQIIQKRNKQELFSLFMTHHLNVMHAPVKFHKNSAEGVIAPAGAKVTGASIRMWLLNKFISFLAVLTWKTGLKKM